MQKTKRRAAVKTAPPEQQSESRATPKKKQRAKAKRAAPARALKTASKRPAARKAPATPKRGRRGGGRKAPTYICRPSGAETALAKQMRDLGRLLKSTARTSRTKLRQRAGARRTR